MTINLSPYNAIEACLLVRIDIASYAGGGPLVLTFSDYNTDLYLNYELYRGLGKFVSVSGSTSELKNSSSGITITISGIPGTSVTDILTSSIKGSPIEVYRGFLDAVTTEILDIPGNPSGRFFGIVNNYSLTESWDNTTRTATNTISLMCSSKTEILENKISGRKTNPSSWRRFNPTDASMDRVPSLIGSNFNFGAPQ